MKHLKLFESFDRYEFGEVTSNLREKHEDIILNSVEISQSEQDEIMKYLADRKTELDVYGIAVLSDDGNDNPFDYEIHSLGDYCYALIHYVPDYGDNADGVIRNIWILDSMDELIPHLIKINDRT